MGVLANALSVRQNCWGSFWNRSSVLSATQSLTYSNLILLLCKCTSFDISLVLWNLEREKESTAKRYFLLNDALWASWERDTQRAFLSHITSSVWKALSFPDGLVREVWMSLGLLPLSLRAAPLSDKSTRNGWETEVCTVHKETLWNRKVSLNMELPASPQFLHWYRASSPLVEQVD